MNDHYRIKEGTEVVEILLWGEVGRSSPQWVVRMSVVAILLWELVASLLGRAFDSKDGSLHLWKDGAAWRW